MTWTQTALKLLDGDGTPRQVIAWTDGVNYAFAHPVLDSTGAAVGPGNPLAVQAGLVNAAGGLDAPRAVAGTGQAGTGLAATAPMLATLTGFDPAPGSAAEGLRVSVAAAGPLVDLITRLLRAVEVTNYLLAEHLGNGPEDLAALAEHPEIFAPDAPAPGGADPAL
jgi:hypothetical protein